MIIWRWNDARWLKGTRTGLVALAGVPHRKGGVQAAVDYLVPAHTSPARAAAE